MVYRVFFRGFCLAFVHDLIRQSYPKPTLALHMGTLDMGNTSAKPFPQFLEVCMAITLLGYLSRNCTYRNFPVRVVVGPFFLFLHFKPSLVGAIRSLTFLWLLEHLSWFALGVFSRRCSAKGNVQVARISEQPGSAFVYEKLWFESHQSFWCETNAPDKPPGFEGSKGQMHPTASKTCTSVHRNEFRTSKKRWT